MRILPERDDYIIWFDSGIFRVFISNHHWRDNKFEVEILDSNQNYDTVYNYDNADSLEECYDLVADYMADRMG